VAPTSGAFGGSGGTYQQGSSGSMTVAKAAIGGGSGGYSSNVTSGSSHAPSAPGGDGAVFLFWTEGF
jgi:hypothetical protein